MNYLDLSRYPRASLAWLLILCINNGDLMIT